MRESRMTPAQFDALLIYIDARLEQRVHQNSAGPGRSERNISVDTSREELRRLLVANG